MDVAQHLTFGNGLLLGIFLAAWWSNYKRKEHGIRLGNVEGTLRELLTLAGTGTLEAKLRELLTLTKRDPDSGPGEPRRR